MKQKWIFIIAPALFLAGVLIALLLMGARDAAQVQQSVLRFHVVADSDTEEDQLLKLKVRDGVFELIRSLFADCSDREEALSAARAHSALLQAEAERILRANGSDIPVRVEIGSRFFPTKSYGGLSFPAGKYQAVSIRLGEAKGENFWCVLYPALCLSPAVAEEDAADEMAALIGEEGAEFLQKSKPLYRIRFALAEWWAYFIEKIS